MKQVCITIFVMTFFFCVAGLFLDITSKQQYVIIIIANLFCLPTVIFLIYATSKTKQSKQPWVAIIIICLLILAIFDVFTIGSHYAFFQRFKFLQFLKREPSLSKENLILSNHELKQTTHQLTQELGNTISIQAQTQKVSNIQDKTIKSQSKLIDDLKKAKDLKAKLIIEINQKNTEISTLTTQLSLKTDTLKKLSKEFQNMKSSGAAVNTENIKNVQTLRQKISQANLTNAGLRAKTNQLTTQIFQLRVELDKLKLETEANASSLLQKNKELNSQGGEKSKLQQIIQKSSDALKITSEKLIQKDQELFKWQQKSVSDKNTINKLRQSMLAQSDIANDLREMVVKMHNAEKKRVLKEEADIKADKDNADYLKAEEKPMDLDYMDDDVLQKSFESLDTIANDANDIMETIDTDANDIMETIDDYTIDDNTQSFIEDETDNYEEDHTQSFIEDEDDDDHAPPTTTASPPVSPDPFAELV